MRTHRHRSLSLLLHYGMIDGERVIISRLGLYHITFMPKIRGNQGLLTALLERWCSEMGSFHLPIGEATVTLEDVWHNV